MGSTQGAGTTAGLRPRFTPVAAAGFLWASAGIHLDLYATGYRRIPIVGPLFLLQAVVGVGLGVAILVEARAAASPRVRRGVQLAGAALAVGTIVAYAASRTFGVFGFHERPTTAGLAAGIVELGAFSVLAAGGGTTRAGAAAPDRQRARGTKRIASTPGRGSAIALASAVLLVSVLVLASGSSSLAAVNGPAVRPLPTSHGERVVRVTISGYNFHPSRILARPGEEITVTNEDHVTHTMTAVPGSVPFGRFNTGYVDPGSTARIRAPRRPGSYAFYCLIHNFMRGVLVVSH